MREDRRKALWVGLIFLGGLELLGFAFLNRPTYDGRLFVSRQKTLAHFLKDHPGDYRILSSTGDINTPLVSSIWGGDPMCLARYARFIAAGQGEDPSALVGAWSGVHSPAPSLGMLRCRYEVRDTPKGLLFLPTGFKEIPRAFLVDRFRVVPDLEKEIQEVVRRGFDPLKSALLESPPQPEPSPSGKAGKIDLKDISPDCLEIRVEVDHPSLLVLGENYAKDWSAVPVEKTPGLSYTVMPVDSIFRGIPLPPGKHDILLEYRPRFFGLGMWISVVSVILWALFTLGIFWKRKGSRFGPK